MKPHNEDNFLIEMTPALYLRLKQEIGDAFTDNIELHFSPYWKDMKQDTLVENKEE